MRMILDVANRTFSADHPALRAWSEIAGKDFAPVDVQVLNERSASRVYRLIGAGPDGSNVIAKRYPAANARAEYRTYQKVLCHLPLTLLRHHGLVQESDAGFYWAFVEDAAGEQYSPEIQQHTVEAAEWLAMLHTSAQGVARSVALPDRNPCYYFDCLRAGRDRISRRLAGSPLNEDGRVILGFLAAQCDAVQASWERIERLCSGAPQTLVYADLNPDNIHVRLRPA